MIVPSRRWFVIVGVPGGDRSARTGVACGGQPSSRCRHALGGGADRRCTAHRCHRPRCISGGARGAPAFSVGGAGGDVPVAESGRFALVVRMREAIPSLLRLQAGRERELTLLPHVETRDEPTHGTGSSRQEREWTAFASSARAVGAGMAAGHARVAVGDHRLSIAEDGGVASAAGTTAAAARRRLPQHSAHRRRAAVREH